MDDKSVVLNNDDNGSSLFPETETRRVAERFAPRPVLMQDRHLDAIQAADATRAIEHALRQGPERPLIKSLRATLDDRNKTHGEFTNDAQTAQRLKAVMRDTVKWSALTDVQCEALEQIATKIGRILSGDPNHKDHWSDIQGYARLVEERL